MQQPPRERLTRIQVGIAVRRFEQMDKAQARIAAQFDAPKISLAKCERLDRESNKIFQEWERLKAAAPPEVIEALQARGLIERSILTLTPEEKQRRTAQAKKRRDEIRRERAQS